MSLRSAPVCSSAVTAAVAFSDHLLRFVFFFADFPTSPATSGIATDTHVSVATKPQRADPASRRPATPIETRWH